jgi:hypothetical protein
MYVAPCSGLPKDPCDVTPEAPCNGRGRRRDDSILKYLRKMIRFCRDSQRRDMVWYYQEAWEFASSKIYGPLPPRKQDLLGTFYQPDNPSVPEGFRPTLRQQPLRKIVKINEHPHGFTTALWEMLECGHELARYPGYCNPVKSRRCIYCAFVAAEKRVAKKLPSSVAIAKVKAVGA